MLVTIDCSYFSITLFFVNIKKILYYIIQILHYTLISLKKIFPAVLHFISSATINFREVKLRPI